MLHLVAAAATTCLWLLPSTRTGWLGRMEGHRSQPGAALDAKERRKANKKRRKKLAKAASSITNSTPGTPSTPPSEGTARSNSGHSGVTDTAETKEAAVAISGKKRPRETTAGGKSKSVFTHPFPTEYGDHFETPLQAYRDVEGALALLAKLMGKKRQHLRIWDPYFCAGRTPRLLAKLGFPKVEHHNQDFYEVIRDNKQPKHDVLVTNPPYSSDHKKRCLEYCRTSGKPWFLLVPNYVATKDYYRLAVLGSAAGVGGEPFYVVPETKYSFDHPEGTGHADSPFSGVWYVHCGSHTSAVFEGLKGDKRGGVSVLRSLDELSRIGAVKTERRLNPRQRKALKKKRSAED